MFGFAKTLLVLGFLTIELVSHDSELLRDRLPAEYYTYLLDCPHWLLRSELAEVRHCLTVVLEPVKLNQGRRSEALEYPKATRVLLFNDS